MATQEAVNNLARELKAEISGLSASIKKVNQTLDSNTAIVDKKVNAVSSTLKKSQEQSQMMMLLPILLSQAPTLTKLSLQAKDAPAGTKPLDFDVKGQEVKKDSTALLLPMMMMMGGGMGGGGDSSNMMMMMMVLVLSGGLG